MLNALSDLQLAGLGPNFFKNLNILHVHLQIRQFEPPQLPPPVAVQLNLSLYLRTARRAAILEGKLPVEVAMIFLN